MSLGRVLLQLAMQSPLCPVTNALRLRASKTLTKAGWKGTLPKEQAAPPSNSDERLWKALLQHDGTAFAELWRRTAASLCGFVSRQLPPTETEDVLISVYAKLYQQGSGWLGRDSIRRADALKERLFRTARALVLRQQAQSAIQQLDAQTLEALPEKDPDGLLRHLLGRETVEVIANALHNACRVLEQEVVLMVADGHPPEKVAAALGLTPDATRAVKHQALAKLRATMHTPKKRRR